MTITSLPDTSPLVARRGLVVFGAAVVALSAPLQAGIITTHAARNPTVLILWMAGLMMVPTVASVVARLWLREGFADLGFRRGRGVGRALGVALTLPVLVGTVAYGAGVLTGLVGLRALPPGVWAALVAAMLLLNLVLAAGEELGWRGYLLPRLVAAGVPRPIVVSSLIWGLWHVPIFLWGDLVHNGPSPQVSAALLMVAILPLGYVLGRMRLDTGNVWPAVLFHAAWNAFIQAGFDPAVTGDTKALWVGETGLLTIAVLIAVALLIRRHSGAGRGRARFGPRSGARRRS